MKVRTVAFAVALALSLSGSAWAGSVAGTGGALEITQLANFGKLVAQYGKQVEMVSNQIKQYQTMLRDLQNMNPQRAAQLLKDKFGLSSMQDVASLLVSTKDLIDTFADLREDVQTIQYEFDTAKSVIEKMRSKGYKFGPNEYAAAMRILAQKQAEGYGERYKRFTASVESARRNIERAERIASEAPKLKGTVEGLAALNVSNAQMLAQLADLQTTLASIGQIQADMASRDARREARENADHDVMVRALQDRRW